MKWQHGAALCCLALQSGMLTLLGVTWDAWQFYVLIGLTLAYAYFVSDARLRALRDALAGEVITYQQKKGT